MTTGESRYLAGYNAGRTACIQAGTSESARRWVADHQHIDPAYLAGYEWALWDYDDANGVEVPTGSRGAARQAQQAAGSAAGASSRTT